MGLSFANLIRSTDAEGSPLISTQPLPTGGVLIQNSNTSGQAQTEPRAQGCEDENEFPVEREDPGIHSVVLPQTSPEASCVPGPGVRARR